MVPTEVNGEKQVPFQGVGKYKPEGRIYGPKISSCMELYEIGVRAITGISTDMTHTKSGLITPFWT